MNIIIIFVSQYIMVNTCDKYIVDNLKFYVWVAERGSFFQCNNLIDTHVFVIPENVKYT